MLDDGSLHAYAISNDRSELWWWFTQASPITDRDEYVVGDFDGDGADEIFVYRPSTGRIRLLERGGDGFIGEAANYSLGSLGNFSSNERKNKLFVADNFGLESNRSDILMIDRGAGQVVRFDTATDDRGKNTFWWAFTSNNRRFAAHDDLAVANIDGGTKDALVVRSRGHGYKFFELEFNNGNLKRRTDIKVGQLPKDTGSHIIAAKVRDNAFRRERAGTRRDDILTYNSKSNVFVRTDARFDKASRQLTHWLAYSADFVLEPPRTPLKRPWAVILCRFRGAAGVPAIESYFQEIFDGMGFNHDLAADLQTPYGDQNCIMSTAAFLGELTIPTRRGSSRSWIEPSGSVVFTVTKSRNDNRQVQVQVRNRRAN